MWVAYSTQVTHPCLNHGCCCIGWLKKQGHWPQLPVKKVLATLQANVVNMFINHPPRSHLQPSSTILCVQHYLPLSSFFQLPHLSPTNSRPLLLHSSHYFYLSITPSRFLLCHRRTSRGIVLTHLRCSLQIYCRVLQWQDIESQSAFGVRYEQE